MEIRNQDKNEAAPKSHTSRKNKMQQIENETEIYNYSNFGIIYRILVWAEDYA